MHHLRQRSCITPTTPLFPSLRKVDLNFDDVRMAVLVQVRGGGGRAVVTVTIERHCQRELGRETLMVVGKYVHIRPRVLCPRVL